MWQIQAMRALDIARERTREADQQALADRARAAQKMEARLHGLSRPSRIRRVTAAALRAVSGALGAVSDAACDAASRLERRTA